jgi:hypothetical protein
MSWSRLTNPIPLALVASLAVWGCATDREVLDRTQPNAIKKSALDGEWYFQQTVVDIPGTWSPTFVGESNFQGMERVRFDIQEHWLYVRRSYERIATAEGGVAADGTGADGRPYLGAVLAAYPITSHFDVKRAYNPTTGEEYNVLEENSVDRPWSERDYLRVDWSQNYAVNFQFMVDDLDVSPVAYYVQDTDKNGDGKPDDPDYPVVEDGYLDVTNMVMVRPGMTYFADLGESFPTCWLFERATADCTTEPIKIRNSFLRLDPKREYVPQPFKGDITDAFGLFTTDRLVFDKHDEVTETRRERYRQIHNLWKRWKNDQGQVIPAPEREVRPMVYYVHNWHKLEPELEGTLRAVEGEWNQIFHDAVAATGNSYAGPVLKFCHVPVPAAEAGDLCGAEGFTPRLGDIRYNWIAYLPKYYDGFALLGLGPSNSDPLTGEVISAGAYLYVYNDIVAQTTAQQVQLLNGDLSPTSFIDGIDLTQWQKRYGARADEAEPAALPDVADVVAQTRITPAPGLHLHPSAAELASLDGRSMRQVMKQLGPSLWDEGLNAAWGNDGGGRLGSLADSYLEDLMINPEIATAVGIAPGQAALSEEMLRSASVARVGPFRTMQALEAKKRALAERRVVDLAAPADDGYLGLAQQWKGQPLEKVRLGIKDQVFHAVLAHELGHSFNLHHNFGGTEDVVNYGDKYWELRAADGTVKPRWVDPPSKAELEGNIYRYAYSSIMDYSRLTLDFGPGKYDRAAILLGYADKVEAFKDTGAVPIGIFNEWSSSDGNVIQFFQDRPRSYHYTSWWRDLGQKLYRADNRVLVDAAEVDWASGFALESGLVRVPYVFCSPYQSDLGNNCHTRDYGADEYERIEHHVQAANTWYITRAFTRFQVGASASGYIGRSYERIYHRLKQYNDIYTLYVQLMAQIYPPEAIDSFLSDDDEGWASYTLAQHAAFGFLLDTVAMPDVAGFEGATDAAGQSFLKKSLFSGAPVQTDVSNGRYFTTSWRESTFDDDCGMYFNECLNHFGFYLDKIMALNALSDPSTNFVARDTAEDVREFAISFYDTYPRAIESFLGAVLAQDYAAFAPRWTGSTVAMPDRLVGPPPTGQLLDPAAGFTVQLYAAVLGMARLQNNYDKHFLLSSRMWVQGSGFAVQSGFGVISYKDPVSGTVYQAVNFPDGSGVAQRMIKRAQAVLSRSSLCPSACATGVSPEDKAAADADLVKYGQLLDVIVDLTGYYETYTQKYGDPYNPG